MFYVAGSKIYLAEFDPVSKVYPEVRLLDGQPEVLSTGVAKKPKNRRICTLQEVLAQFGPTTVVDMKHKEKKED